MNLMSVLIYIMTFFGVYTTIFFFYTLFEFKHKLGNPKIKNIKKVTICVPAYNEEKHLAKTVESLLNLDYPKDKLEIIIVDDGSKDRTYEIAKKFEKYNVKVFTKKNEGKGMALNFALKHSTGELFGALDADSFVNKDALKKMIGYFEDSNVMAVTPSLKVYKPENMLQKIQYIEYLFGVFLRKIFAFLGSIHVTPGPFTIYRKYFFDKYGGYDENNPTEDIEIALRIQSKHYEIDNSANANVYTVAPRTFRSLLKQRIRWYLGFINNVLNYRRLFSKGYGDLGVFILPASFISIAFVITMLIYTISIFFKNLINDFINYKAISFDVLTLLNLDFDFFFVNPGLLTILSLVSISATILILIIAKSISEEKKKIKFYYIFYFLFYWMLFGFWWVIAGVYKMIGKKVVWGQRSL